MILKGRRSTASIEKNKNERLNALCRVKEGNWRENIS
jgi:hypothetical protein